jgi:polyphosphate glucokinase
MPTTSERILGIDIGGTGIKGAPVDVVSGSLLTDRHRILTPHPATPGAVADAVHDLVRFFDWTGPVGATFPAVIKKGVAQTAANVDESWIGTNVADLFTCEVRCPVTVVNDADAAGLAEMRYGAGAGRGGVVLMVTLGTGIGSALFLDGKLVPNTEFGHIEIRGKDAEHRAAESVREAESLSWKKWAKRLNEYFATVEMLLSPDLIIVGGGVSKKSDRFLPLLDTQAEIVPAKLLNDAGIVGAAEAARQAGEGAPPFWLQTGRASAPDLQPE